MHQIGGVEREGETESINLVQDQSTTNHSDFRSVVLYVKVLKNKNFRKRLLEEKGRKLFCHVYTVHAKQNFIILTSAGVDFLGYIQVDKQDLTNMSHQSLQRWRHINISELLTKSYVTKQSILFPWKSEHLSTSLYGTSLLQKTSLGQYLLIINDS